MPYTIHFNASHPHYSMPNKNITYYPFLANIGKIQACHIPGHRFPFQRIIIYPSAYITNSIMNNFAHNICQLIYTV